MSDGDKADKPVPIFRFGDPSTATDGEIVTMYDEDDLVPASHFGMKIVDDGRKGPLELVLPLREVEVRLDKVWGYQDRVSLTHVQNLASVPGDAFVGEHAPQAIEWFDGTYQVIGHHRVSAAYLRGDSTIRVRVGKRVTRLS